MSNPSRPTPQFSFGQPGANDTSETPKQGFGMSGSGMNPPTTSTANIFGNTSASAGNTSVFGRGSSTSFGGGNKSFTGFNLGQPQKSTAGGVSGSEQTGPQSSQTSNDTPSSTMFSPFSTPNKSSEQSAGGQSQISNLFGHGGGSDGTFSFGNLGVNASSAGQTSTTTPTSKPTTSVFGNSTTPAGPPPSSGAGTSSVLLGKPPQDAGSLFANLGKTSSAPGTGPATPQASGSSAFSFGASKPQAPTGATSSTQAPSIFGSNMFGNLNKPQDSGANKPATSQQQNEPSKTLFGLGGPSSGNTSTAQSTGGSILGGVSAPTFSFPKASEPQPPASNTVASPTASPGGFKFFNKPASSSTTAPSTSAPSLSMFSNLGKPQDKDKPPATSTEASGTSASSTSAPAPISNLFAPKTADSAPAPTSNLFAPKTADPAPTSQPPAPPNMTEKAPSNGGAAANLGASTAGPLPPAQSRLKNKSMDDIITRWAADLSKYQKEFQQQAGKVAAWDRMLVENSEKIQKLYGSTLEAERATTEVERQLTAVENDQAELSMWLDHYEREVDSMISNSVGQGDTLSGPDQERERTYQLASKLQDRLDEMGNDLSAMIEEINDASSNLSKNSKADDPLSQVVRVLNSHLTQLQHIDQGAAALQLKVKEAQRASQSIGPSNGLSGPSSDAADGFYRSFMGRR